MHSRLVRLCAAVLVLSMGTAPVLRAEWTFEPKTGGWVRTDARDVDHEVADAQFERAIEDFKQGRADDAERIIQAWLRFYRMQEDCQYALFLLGQIRQNLGHYDQAQEAYEELLDRYAGTPLFDLAMDAQIEMAKAYLEGKKRKILKMLWVPAQDEGETILQKVSQRDPHGRHGRTALLTLAEYHYSKGRFDDARDEYLKLASSFPSDADVTKWKFQAAGAALANFRGTRYEERPLREARQQFDQFSQQHPIEAVQQNVPRIIQGIDERRAQKDFEIADFYRRTGKSKAAAYYYRAIARDYAGSVWAGRAHDQMVAMGLSEVNEPRQAPRVMAAGVNLNADADFPGQTDRTFSQPAVAVNRSESPLSNEPDPDSGLPPGPPVVLWAGPAAVVREPDDSGVVDIGTPVDRVPAVPQVGQLGDVGVVIEPPPPYPPSSQPEQP